MEVRQEKEEEEMEDKADTANCCFYLKGTYVVIFSIVFCL